MLFIFDINDFKVHVVFSVITSYLILFCYLYIYRDLICGYFKKIAFSELNIIRIFKTGIPLLLSNFISTVILTIDKQFVDFFFTIEDFSIYSFAFSLISMIFFIISSIGILLYPELKKGKVEKFSLSYYILNKLIILIVLMGLIFYFPMNLLITNFLPEFTRSLIIFRIALPMLMFTSSIIVVKHNFYKIYSKNVTFFVIGIIVLLLSIISMYLVVSFFNNIFFITLSSLIISIFWYFILEFYMVIKYKIHWKENTLIITFGLIGFYLSTSINSTYLGIISYSIFIVVILLLNVTFFKKLKKEFL
jgi:O-antigen/teichoic acid export membrane protein